jgi:hypothetical protein
MNAPGTTEALGGALHHWCEILEALRLTLVEDRPSPGLSALGDGLADGADAVIGWLREAEANLAGANARTEVPRLVGRAVRCQGETLFGPAYQIQLERLARAGGAPWAAWVRAVRGAAEPLWGCAEATVQQLGASPPARSPDLLSHTTYHSTHFAHSDTIHPSAE